MRRKKYLFIIVVLLLLINRVKADEQNIKIKYKWYKEEIVDELYYEKRKKLDGYFENPDKIQYTDFTEWDNKYCGSSKQYYIMESQIVNYYEIVAPVRYIEFLGLKYDKNIQVYNGNIKLYYFVTYSEKDKTIIRLDKEFEPNELWLYVTSDTPYEIIFYKDYERTIRSLSKNIEDESLLIPNESWINNKTNYISETTTENKRLTAYRKIQNAIQRCRVKEIKTYRYKIGKIYYDDNYYEYVEGYIPDVNDYIIESLPKENIEITKTVTEKEIQKEKEYIYVPEKREKQQLLQPQIVTKIKTEYRNKFIIKYKMPKYVYYLYLFFIIVIIFITILLFRKKSIKKNN